MIWLLKPAHDSQICLGNYLQKRFTFIYFAKKTEGVNNIKYMDKIYTIFLNPVQQQFQVNLLTIIDTSNKTILNRKVSWFFSFSFQIMWSV